MPRRPRRDPPGALHHIMGMGTERPASCRPAYDREDFPERPADLCRKDNLRVDVQPANRLAVSQEVISLPRYHKLF
jgi:hypothetical protein